MHIDNLSDLNQQMQAIAAESNTPVNQHTLALSQGRLRNGELAYFIKFTNTTTSPISVHNILISDSLANELILKSNDTLKPISN